MRARSVVPLLLGLAGLALAGCGGHEEIEVEVDELYLDYLRALADKAEDGQPPGRWRPLHGGGEALTEEQLSAIAELEAIGYASHTDVEAFGETVVVHDPARVQPGWNFTTSGHGPEAALLDPSGEVVHIWRMPFREVWPEHPAPPDSPGLEQWRRATLCDDGDVIAIFEGLGVIRVDRDSKLVWANPCRAHHDLELLDDGRLWVLTREARVRPEIHPNQPVLEDFVTLLDRRGRVVRNVSLLDAILGTEFEAMCQPILGRGGDVFHTNAVELVPRGTYDRFGDLEAGQLLLSMRATDMLALLDLDEERIVWASKGPFARQHDPHVLEDGRLLLFDNLGEETNSVALEWHPVEDRTLWAYRGEPDDPLLSATCGTVQRLENGNTLVTESDAGRAREVSPEGELVWEFRNPFRAGEGGAWVATLFELRRVDDALVREWL